MAEAIVIPLVETLTVALAPEALNQVCSLTAPVNEARRRIKRIKSEFTVMQAFLKHTDSLKDHNEALAAWQEELRDVAYQVEDILDEYTYLMEKRGKARFSNFLCRTFCDTKNAKVWHRIVTQLRAIEVKLRDLSEIKQRYGIKMTDEAMSSIGVDERLQHLAESAHFLEKDDIVGIEKNKDMLVKWLTDEDQRRTIISVWGMGGLGKTTLVTSVYESLKYSQFDCHAWITVSQNYTTNNLLRRILKEIYQGKKDQVPNIDAMDYRSLVETLRKYFQQRRYIIIFDDVWNRDVWTDINGAFLDSKCGSRIVITTRIHDVALLASEHRLLKLQPLEKNEAWTLFCRNAFRREIDAYCPEELHYWARKILKKCEGLPLAIVAIGNLLSLKEKSELTWKKVYDSLSWEMSENPNLNEVSSSILNLSFNDLPYQLKKCLLFCGIFPEDYLIKRNRLIRLWVAEGFARGRGAKTMEEVAEEYLNELIHRCMLQVAEKNNFGRLKACRMHDLVRELVLVKSKRENFCMVYDDNSESKMADGVRHLSFNRKNKAFQLGGGTKNLHSFFVFDADMFSSTVSLQSVLSSFRLLRVLDLRRVPIERLPEQVFHLFHLHYLGLRQIKIKEISGPWGKLQNLQTLDLWGTDVVRLPHEITKVRNLRHLIVGEISDPTSTSYNPTRGVHAARGIWDLKGLQTLQNVQANEEMIGCLGNLTELRCFCVTKVRGIHGLELCTSITKMSHLLRLGITARDQGEELQLGALSQPPAFLQKLVLHGKLQKQMVPHWFYYLKNLLHLELYWSGLREDPLPSLCPLTNLVDLRFLQAYDGQELFFHAGWFPKLTKLFLCNLTQLNCIRIETGSLVNLQELFLLRCGELKVMPHGIENLEALKIWELVEMPEELVEMLRGQENGMENHLQVQHIPTIKNWLQREGRWEILSWPY